MRRSRHASVLSRLVLAGTLLCSLSACGARQIDRVDLRTAPHFWQRVDATSAIWQRGPKAQQLLNRDISRCVTELRELERLNAIRYVTPGELAEDGTVPDPDTPSGSLAQWDTPERDGYLRAEHLPYHDFETCMYAKGWERIEHVPYDVAEEGRENYIEAIIGEQYQTKTRQREPLFVEPEGDFEGINN